MRHGMAWLALSLVSIAVFLLVFAPGALPSAHAQSQVPLTASFSVVGGGSGYQDLLTYTSNGVEQIVPLTSTPTVYQVDSGTTWSVQQVLSGSTYYERWVTQSTDISGTLGSSLTISYTYYHQYLDTFQFSVATGGGYTPPSVSIDEFGIPVTASMGQQWVDASSYYAYSDTLGGATTGEEWITLNSTGLAPTEGAVTVDYVQQFEITSVYSILYGSSLPTVPMLSTTVLGHGVLVSMTLTSTSMWAQPGSSYAFTYSEISTKGNERWIGTTDSGGSLTFGIYNGTLNGPITVDIAFVHQYLVKTQFSFPGGDDIEALPAASYQSFNVALSTTQNTTIWVDAGTQYSVPQNINGAVAGLERWQLDNVTQGSFNGPTEIAMAYYHQFFVAFSYAISGQAPITPSGQPDLSFPFLGNAQLLTLSPTPQPVWIDTASAYTATSTLSSSTSTERWAASPASGTVDANDVNPGIVIPYAQQYLLTVDNGGSPSQWVVAGNNVTLNTPAVFGRSAGIGSRAISYQIDFGNPVKIPAPTATLSIEIAMNGPHTISFSSVTQFEVTLDQGAGAALSSITLPTAPGDNYWYDSGTPVEVTLNGVYDRAGGSGERITSITVTGESGLPVNTVGTVQAFNALSLSGPITITTTSLKQYEVVLNSAAKSALATISPPSTFLNDTFWYDNGSPDVTVTLNGVFSRAGGTGDRLTSWELNSGGVNKVASLQPVSVTTASLSSPQFINATIATQYQVTLDSGATSALASLTAPAIPGDTGWFDSTTPVNLVLKGTWNRASGTGERLASVTINGVPEAVASVGTVDILTADQISQPEAITGSTVTQYEITLDSGGTAGLASITPTSISQDKYWYDAGTQVTVALNGVWGRASTSGTRLVSYSVDKGTPTKVLSLVPVNAVTLSAISSAQTITTTTVNQYEVTSPVSWASITNSTVPGDSPGWYDSGTRVNATYNDFYGASLQSRQSVSTYSFDGGSKTAVQATLNGTFTISLSMTKAHTISLTSVTQYLLTIKGPSQFKANPPSPTNDSYFDSGAKENFTVSTTWSGTIPRTRELLSSYSVDGLSPVPVNTSSSSVEFTVPTITFTGAENIDFGSVTQFEIGFNLFDGTGAVAVNPSLVELGIGNQTVEAEGPAWLVNGTSFSFLNIIWEGVNVAPDPSPTFKVDAAPINVTLDTKVYPVSLKVVDVLGLPAAGAHVSMTLANDTTISGFTKSNGVFEAGLIPLGTYSAQVTSVGIGSHVSGNTVAAARPQLERVPLSLISLLVILAAAAGGGSGAFFLLRKRRSKVSGPK